MIYHFCNDSFGAPFAACSREWAKRERIGVTQIFATRAPSIRDRVSRALHAAAERAANPYLRTLYMEDINAPDFADRIRPGDNGIVTGYRQIFKSATIARFASLVNVHPSILPHYRGPAPTHWCLERGETQTGFTLHAITPRIDDGPILYQEVVPIQPDDTRVGLAIRIAHAALPVFERYLNALAGRGSWVSSSLDAEGVYRNAMGYGSFPP